MKVDKILLITQTQGKRRKSLQEMGKGVSTNKLERDTLQNSNNFKHLNVNYNHNKNSKVRRVTLYSTKKSTLLTTSNNAFFFYRTQKIVPWVYQENPFLSLFFLC